MIFLLLLSALTAFTSADDRKDPAVRLKGHWLSCPDAENGDYGERAFEYQSHGKIRWNFHMGPRDEFALFPGPLPAEHVHHLDPSNRLSAHHYGDIATRVGGRNWSALGVHINVVKVHSDAAECYAFWIKVESLQQGRAAE